MLTPHTPSLAGLTRVGVMGVVVTLGGCATIPPDAELVPVQPARSMEVTLAAGEALALDLPLGEVSIDTHASPSLVATMTVRCPRDSRRCHAWAEAADFVTTRRSDRLHVGLNKTARSGVVVTTTVLLPPDTPLDVRLGYGDLVISGLERDLSVTMRAGDVNISMPRAAVASAHLAATFGDASLYDVDIDTELEGRRPLLVGASVDWQDGPGTHLVDVRLRFGNVRLKLYR